MKCLPVNQMQLGLLYTSRNLPQHQHDIALSFNVLLLPIHSLLCDTSSDLVVHVHCWKQSHIYTVCVVNVDG